MFTARPCVVEAASASATRGGRRARGDVVVVVSRVVVPRFSSSARAGGGAPPPDAGERVGEKAREREEKMDDGDVGAAPREGARRRARGSGTGRMNTHASSGRFAARASAAEARERVSGTGEGGGGEAATAAATDEETANGAKTVPKPRPKSKPRLKSKPKQTSEREEWWKTLDDEACDPITLEPLNALAHAPFELGGHEAPLGGRVARICLSELECIRGGAEHRRRAACGGGRMHARARRGAVRAIWLGARNRVPRAVNWVGDRVCP